MDQAKEIAIKDKLTGEQLFKISRFKEVIKRTNPHKHKGYLEIIYLSEGAGYHWIDTQKFKINPPVVYLLSGQLHYWEMTAIPKGYVLLFKEEFIDPVHNSSLVNLLMKLQGGSEFLLSEDPGISFILQEMEREYASQKAYLRELLTGYLQVFLAKLLSAKELPGENNNRLSGDFRKFHNLLMISHPISNLKVSDLADKMNISPQTLNTICRKATGKSTSELISEQVVLEAKRYIIHTDKSISEISEALKFTDPSHFNKYFKNHTGQTPQQFRTSFQ